MPIKDVYIQALDTLPRVRLTLDLTYKDFTAYILCSGFTDLEQGIKRHCCPKEKLSFRENKQPL